MDDANRLVRTQPRMWIVKVLVDAEKPLAAAEIARRAQVSDDVVRETLLRMESIGWVCAPKQPPSRKGLTRYFELTEKGRPLARDFLA